MGRFSVFLETLISGRIPRKRQFQKRQAAHCKIALCGFCEARIAWRHTNGLGLVLWVRL